MANFHKVSFLGDSGVGKTSLIRSYLGNAERVESTIGVELYTLTTDTKKIVVWDFSGQRWFVDVLINFLKGTDLVTLVFDLSEPRTLPKILTFWLPQIVEYYSREKPFILVGNKMDIERIDREMLDKFVKKFEENLNLFGFYRTSIYMPETVKALFDGIVKVLGEGEK